MFYSQEEILETIKMSELEHFDVRTVTLGISLRDCTSREPKEFMDNIYKKITQSAKTL